jgi:Ca2+:H+ antiporter
LLTYACTLFFSLRTHKQLFIGAGHESKTHEVGQWSKGRAIAVLLVATILVAVMSEFLVGSVEGARQRLGLTEVFVGIIVVAIIGNAAEHSTAVMMALKNKMDLSLGIAIGSSLQIALFVAPVLVFVSGFLGHQMDLEFSIPEVVAVIVAVHLVAQITGDGESNWLEGIQLLAVYVILAILFFFLPSGAAAH